jgi:hypothetical protein
MASRISARSKNRACRSPHRDRSITKRSSKLRLEGGADQDGHVAVLAAGLVRRPSSRSISSASAGFGVAVPDAADHHLLAALALGPQRLAQAGFVGGDQAEAAARMWLVER